MPKFEQKIKINQPFFMKKGKEHKINPKKSRDFLGTPLNLLSKNNRASTKIAEFLWEGLDVSVERA